MKTILLAFILLFSVHVKAEVKYVMLSSSVQFFRQTLADEVTLPISIGQKQNLNVDFSLDSEDGLSVKKVFTTQVNVPPNDINPNTLKAIIEVYYFNRPEGQYFSQQVFVFRNVQVIAKCTSYFPIEQNYLVPGVCSGRDGESLFGIALYK